MRSFDIRPPADVPAPPASLGRLGAALQRLAAQQGAWPPVVPAAVSRVASGADRTAGQSTDDALEAGVRAADALADSGADLVVVEGGRDRGPALVLLAGLLGRDPVAVVGTTPSAGWAQLVATVRDGLRVARPHLWDPPGLLAAVGSAQIAELTGLLLQLAARRTPVLLSGAPDVWAAVLVAQRVDSHAPAWLTAGCSPATEAASDAVAEARLVPLLDLGLDVPEGAELALGVLLGGARLAAAGA